MSTWEVQPGGENTVARYRAASQAQARGSRAACGLRCIFMERCTAVRVLCILRESGYLLLVALLCARACTYVYGPWPMVRPRFFTRVGSANLTCLLLLCARVYVRVGGGRPRRFTASGNFVRHYIYGQTGYGGLVTEPLGSRVSRNLSVRCLCYSLNQPPASVESSGPPPRGAWGPAGGAGRRSAGRWVGVSGLSVKIGYIIP